MAEKPAQEKVALAHFKTLPPSGTTAVEFDVHFNPASLQYIVSNTLKEEGSGARKKQYVDKTTAKLTMQLVFDTTDTGKDVRTHTDKAAKLLEPIPEGQKQVPPNVEFSWGLYRFTGMVEKYKETIDFFAASGVPLRATIDLTLASQDVQFDSAKNPPAEVDRNLKPEPAVVPGNGGPSGLANALGDPRAARAIASANGSASLRFGVEGGLAVGAGVELKAEAAFSAGAGAGAGAGFGVGGGAGFGIGAGLRSTVSTSSAMPSARAVLASSHVVGEVGTGARFGAGGQAQAQAGGSLGADVGAEADADILIRSD